LIGFNFLSVDAFILVTNPSMAYSNSTPAFYPYPTNTTVAAPSPFYPSYIPPFYSPKPKPVVFNILRPTKL